MRIMHYLYANIYKRNFKLNNKRNTKLNLLTRKKNSSRFFFLYN